MSICRSTRDISKCILDLLREMANPSLENNASSTFEVQMTWVRIPLDCLFDSQ